MYMNENSFRPTIFNFKKRRDRIDAQKLIRTKKIQFIVDEVGEQKKELGFVHNPKFFFLLSYFVYNKLDFFCSYKLLGIYTIPPFFKIKNGWPKRVLVHIHFCSTE